MHKTVILSDGEPCKIRCLGLFELDDKAPDILGPYRYTMLLATGQTVEDEYVLPPTPPEKPDTDKPEPGSFEYSQLLEYETYQAAIAHEKLRLESAEEHTRQIATYLMTTCLAEVDQIRIITDQDYRKVKQAAIVPQLTEEVLADTLRQTFQGIIW